jgi:hypothetical protein
VGRRIGSVIAAFFGSMVLVVPSNAFFAARFPAAFDASGRTDDPRILASMLIVSALSITLAAYVLARWSGPAAMRDVMSLAGLKLALIILFPILKLAGTPQAPSWYFLADAALTFPAALLGGLLAHRSVAGANESV